MRAPTRHRERRQLLPHDHTARLVTLLCAGVLTVAGLGGGRALSSTALLTDSRSLSSTAVSTGTLSLSVSGGAASGTWTGSFSLVPGASAYAGLTVANQGSVAMRYAVSGLSTSSLAALLRVTIVALPSGTTSCSASTHATGTLVSTPDGPFGASPAVDVIGSVSVGAQAGDRTVAAAAGERLCLRVSFPLGTGAGAAARGTTASATFTVAAESA